MLCYAMLCYAMLCYAMLCYAILYSKFLKSTSDLPLHVPSCALLLGYRLWINGLFVWHKSHPEMTLHFLQMAMEWLGSQQDELANLGLILCRAVRFQGIRDLTLPLANGLLMTLLHGDMIPEKRLLALELLERCQIAYPHLKVETAIELLESVMSWKEEEVRNKTHFVAAYMLEAIMVDDETFALANQNMTSMARADARGEVDKAAAKKQKVLGLLRDSKTCRNVQLKKRKEKGNFHIHACSICPSASMCC